jgi:hypothetical protein
MTDTTPFLPGLSPLGQRSLTVSRDAGEVSANGGLLVLREAARRLGLGAAIAAPLPDPRSPLLIHHTYESMVTARMMAIAAGYEDVDDLDHLRHDPALLLACERTPGHDWAIPSQPTVCRLENIADTKSLYRIAMNFIDLFCRGYARPPDSIVLDIDDTADLVHGGQQLALFNTHAGGHCFQTMHIFEANSGKPLLSLLRPGKRPTGKEIARVLWHVIHRIRRHWPKVRILVRGDSHYCAPEVLDLLRRLDCWFMLGLATNSVLEEIAKPWRSQCENQRKASVPKVRRFQQFHYSAESWSRAEKVVARIEATALGSDVRFVVTNLPGRAKTLYEKVYCARGRMENLIKDMKLYTRSDKTACSRWQANQLRLFLHMGAYWLLHSLRLAAPKKSRWRGATFATLRTMFVKIALRVEVLKRTIKVAFPNAFPHADALGLISAALTARGS